MLVFFIAPSASSTAVCPFCSVSLCSYEIGLFTLLGHVRRTLLLLLVCFEHMQQVIQFSSLFNAVKTKIYQTIVAAPGQNRFSTLHRVTA